MEEGVEVRLGGARCGGLADGGCGGAMGLGGLARMHLERLEGRGGGPPRKDVISGGDGIHGGNRRGQGARAEPGKGVKRER